MVGGVLGKLARMRGNQGLFGNPADSIASQTVPACVRAEILRRHRRFPDCPVSSPRGTADHSVSGVQRVSASVVPHVSSGAMDGIQCLVRRDLVVARLHRQPAESRCRTIAVSRLRGSAGKGFVNLVVETGRRGVDARTGRTGEMEQAIVVDVRVMPPDGDPVTALGGRPWRPVPGRPGPARAAGPGGDVDVRGRTSVRVGHRLGDPASFRRMATEKMARERKPDSHGEIASIGHVRRPTSRGRVIACPPVLSGRCTRPANLSESRVHRATP